MLACQLEAPHPSLPPLHPGETKPQLSSREQQCPPCKGPRQRGQSGALGRSCPCSSGSEPSPGRGTSVLAGKDLWSWLWNRALFTYPVWQASTARTCKSDNRQEKASSSWFVKGRPWAIVLSASHRSLESMELWLQLHHGESVSYYLDCGKLQNSNNTEGNCFFLGFVKIPNWDQVHWQVLSCCWFRRTLERFGWAAERSQAKISVFSWVFLNNAFFMRAADRQEEFEFPEIIWTVKQTAMGARRLCFWWNQKWSAWSRMASIHRSELQLNHWLPEGNSPSEMQRRDLAAKKNWNLGTILGIVVGPLVSNNDLLRIIENWKSKFKFWVSGHSFSQKYCTKTVLTTNDNS